MTTVKNFDLVPFALPLHRYRDRPSATDTIPLPTFTDHY
jgi:hypothetical protein